MNQFETICPSLEQKVEGLEPERPRHVAVRKPKMLRGQDGRIIGCARRTQQELQEDFWKRVKVGGMDECWEWQAGMNDKPPKHYGVVWTNGIKQKTHVFAFESVRGPTNGLCVCHRCDNPPCCNPFHLFGGTHSDNMTDKVSKGRANLERGEDRYNATLTEGDIRSIRSRHRKFGGSEKGRALAKEFGVGETMISSIVHGHRWKHVT